MVHRQTDRQKQTDYNNPLLSSSVNNGAIHPSFDVFYLRIRAVLKWKTLLPHINFPKTTLVRCFV